MDETLFAEALLKAEGLPLSFRAEVTRLWRPLADRIAAEHAPGRMRVIGLCGPQGSGKTTGAMALERLFGALGLSVARLSIDDLYLGRAERLGLAEEVHPLLVTRGPPGTHDPALGVQVLEALSRPGEIPLPRFDKASDDRVPKTGWPIKEGPVDVAILEGWCVGALPQPLETLTRPVNALEMEEDKDGVWRRYVNDALAGPYQILFDRIDTLVQLRAPSFETVLGWRQEQEHKLRAKAAKGAGVMSDGEVARFIQHYERLTRWIDMEMPARAQVLVRLGEDRAPIDILGL